MPRCRDLIVVSVSSDDVVHVREHFFGALGFWVELGENEGVLLIKLIFLFNGILIVTRQRTKSFIM